MKTEDIKRMALAYQAVTEKKLDPVGQADADIDNDGDVDKSDKYLHNRRKAIKKAMNKESVEDVHEIAGNHPFKGLSSGRKGWTYISFKNKHSDKPDLGGESDKFGHDSKAHEEHTRIIRHLHKTMPDKISKTQNIIYQSGRPGAGHAAVYVRDKHKDEVHKAIQAAGGRVTYHNHDKVNESVDIDANNVDKAIKHDCATHVTSEKFGHGTCISGMHTIEEQEDGTGVVTHYDVLFEHGIEEMVPVSELKITKSESHMHSRKKMKEAADRSAHYKGATPPEPMVKDDARSEKKMKDGHPIQKGILGKDVEEMGHDDASKAGRITKKAPARKGDNAAADKMQAPVDTTKKGGFSEMVHSIVAAYRSMYEEVDKHGTVSQPSHTSSFAGDEHYKYGGVNGRPGEHANKDANLSDKHAMDHYKASEDHRDASAYHNHKARSATSEKSKRAHYDAAAAHRDAAEYHEKAHFEGATNHDVHMAHHIGQFANDKSAYVRNYITKKAK